MSSRKRKSFAEKIADLANPSSVDPEDLDDGFEAHVSRESHGIYDDADPSTSRSKLRKLPSLDEMGTQYSGTVVSRKDMASSSEDSSGDDDDDDDEEEDEEEDDSSDADGDDQMTEPQGNDSDSGSSEEEDSDGDEIDYGDDSFAKMFGAADSSVVDKLNKLEEEDKAALFKKSLGQQDSAERASHAASQRQLWDALLNVRIRLQQPMTSANRLPGQSELLSFVRHAPAGLHPEIRRRWAHLLKESRCLLHDFLELQTALCHQNSKLPKVDASDVGADPAGMDVDVMWRTLSAWNDELRPYRTSLIDKWNRRTQITTGKEALSRKAFKVLNQSVVSQIENTLSDRSRLIRRTQVKRSADRVLGRQSKKQKPNATTRSQDEEVTPLHDANIFDDTDFYHSLLKDLISSSAEVDVDPKLLRSVKAARRRSKKQVDRRASKGRKIRYVVHPKLVNFMAPVKKHEESAITDRLVASLFAE